MLMCEANFERITGMGAGSDDLENAQLRMNRYWQLETDCHW